MLQLNLPLCILDESLIKPWIRVWPGDLQYPMMTLQEAYNEGHKRGREWPDRWAHVPGGPYATHPRRGKDDPHYAQCQHSIRVREQWLCGWHDGFTAQHLASGTPPWYELSARWSDMG